MQRVMIIGQPGSGKSTLARAIGAVTGLPVIHIDQIIWSDGWIKRADLEQDAMVHAAHARAAWVFEGGRSSTWDARMARADTLIWIDLPLPLRLFRVVRRTVQNHGHSRADLPDGCPDRFDPEFFRWIWRTRRTHRALCHSQFERAPAGMVTHHLKTRQQVADYIATLMTAAVSTP